MASVVLLLCIIYFVNAVGEQRSCALVRLSGPGQYPRISWLLVLQLKNLLPVHFFSLVNNWCVLSGSL